LVHQTIIYLHLQIPPVGAMKKGLSPAPLGKPGELLPPPNLGKPPDPPKV
jgi:hypothetical protein